MLTQNSHHVRLLHPNACSQQARTTPPRSPRAYGYVLGAVGLLVGASTISFSSRGRLLADSVSGTGDWSSGPTYVLHRGEYVRADDPSLPQRNARFILGGDIDVLPSAPSGQEAAPQAPKQNTAWQNMSNRVASVQKAFCNVGDSIADYIMPLWAKSLPGFISKLQRELDMAPGTLAEEIWAEANDPEINPEIMWDAKVRISNDLCVEEQDFLRHRKHFTRKALASYLDLPEHELHPDDIPVIAMSGSGGGLRALTACTSSFLAAKEAGLFDCVTYTAGVSGSCWAQSLFYSSLGKQSHEHMLQHLKNRLGTHIAYPPTALQLLTSAPTNKFLLSGFVEKLRGIPNADFGLVDVYGLLLGARLLVPKGELGVNDYDLKVSNQRTYIDDGAFPLPIYTAVRHEIPLVQRTEEGLQEAVEKAAKESWFQWFEFTPYEFWCEELNCGIPTWAVGRKFEGGNTVWRENGFVLPELRLTLLFGIWGSAFCATLSHYYAEIRPVIKGLSMFTEIDSLIAEKDSDMQKVHPIDPATIPNFALGLKDQLPKSVPESIFQSENLQLMDAGMSNNLPLYPLLRPGRNIDMIIAFDVSSDMKDANWLKVADGYSRQRGIKGWPVGAGWPPDDESAKEMGKDLEDAQAASEEEAAQRLKQAQQEDKKHKAQAYLEGKPADLDFCNIWVGTTEERTTDKNVPVSKRKEEDWQLMSDSPDAGMTVIYFPFLANSAVPGVDPWKAEYMSTWNFIYTPDQIDDVVSLAKANFAEGEGRVKRAVRAVYERKKKQRERTEQEERKERQMWKMRMGRFGKKFGEGDHADQFS